MKLLEHPKRLVELPQDCQHPISYLGQAHVQGFRGSKSHLTANQLKVCSGIQLDLSSFTPNSHLVETNIAPGGNKFAPHGNLESVELAFRADLSFALDNSEELQIVMRETKCIEIIRLIRTWRKSNSH